MLGQLLSVLPTPNVKAVREEEVKLWGTPATIDLFSLRKLVP